MKRYQHDLPFGAAVVPEGVRIRLWAPARADVQVVWKHGPASGEAPMSAQEGGWFEWMAHELGAGARYGFRLKNGLLVPDPASRFQPEDVHSMSEVIDPLSFGWVDDGWCGRPWEEAVIYELHVGSFSPEGTFGAVAERLDALVDLGVTAIELMPVADFPGARSWGYDGVYLFAPENRYGRPDDLKALVQLAHRRGLMVLLDVVYNHFGPEGNYLHHYAPDFFTDRHQTPWGDAINFDGHGRQTVRDFYIQNALYWINEYRFDGLRLDAVHAIRDDSVPDILEDIARAVQAGPGRERHVHLILENDRNEARYLTRAAGGRPRAYTAQWNDDIHHALHVLTTGERSGYYADYADAPVANLARCLAEGFAYQGEASRYRGGAPRGEPSAGLPATAFVSFLQTHDQVGNRAFGERISRLAAPEALRAAAAIVLIAPQVPLIFMGEEWGARTPFPYFCDFTGDLSAAVREGRRREFARFPEFSDAATRETFPDPNGPATFQSAILDWLEREEGEHRDWQVFYGDLLRVRHREIVPRLAGLRVDARAVLVGKTGLRVDWVLGDGSRLVLAANLSAEPLRDAPIPAGHALVRVGEAEAHGRDLKPWTVLWFLETNPTGGD